MVPHPPVSADSRARAARAVASVLVSRRYLDTVLEETRVENAPEQNALVQELAYGTLRWFHQLAGIADLFLQKPLKPKDQDLRALLLIGLYQLRSMRVAPHAAVTETVKAAAALGKPWAKGLINACLRAALRQSERIETTITATAELKYSHPSWLITELRQIYPTAWEDILNANNQRPPMTLRVNLQRTTREEYLACLSANALEARALDITDCAIELTRPIAVDRLPGFAEGLVSVQDTAAQLAAVLLDAQPGERILDACAAPGGKTAHILERSLGQIELTALDIDQIRLSRVRANLNRLGLQAQVLEGDATHPDNWWDGQPFDRILLDVPCSATGIIRRHPDIKVRRRPEDLSALLATQARLITAAWPCLRQGGKLLYSTCSILPSENEQQMATFLEHSSHNAAPVTLFSRATGRQILPGESGMDGFYYGCVRKL